MVSFFTFMTLMGYAFIGLLIDGGDEKTRRAGRIYLVLLILADIALFEALLIAARSTDDLGYEAVALAIPPSPSSALYLSMVIAGFALKAGFWPLHVWLPLAYGSARPAVALLLWVVPVGTGLFGAVRWLPLGELSAPIAGTLLQALGVAGILYALLFKVMRAQWKQLPAHTAIIAVGMFAMGLGTGLLDPAVWNQYGHLVPVFVAAVGLALAIMIAAFVWLEKREVFPSESDREALWLERWAKDIIRWGRRAGGDTLPELCALWLARWDSFWQAFTWQELFDAGEYLLQRWELAITLFLLLGMVSVALLWLDATSVL
nr:proton-conducting transporter membrane subunit [Neptunomonas qingdaonensis]